MAAAQGHQCDFVDSVPGDYYCKKCSLVARRLTVTSCCEGHFCFSCIADSQQQDKPCPECGEQSFSCFEVVRHQKHIASLKVYCTLKGRGCDWSGTLEELEAHFDPDQDNCQYVDTKCPLNCQQAIPKNKVEQHVKEECIKRRHVCQHCNFKATYEEVVDTHLPECMYVPLQCPNFCGVTSEREVMEDHMKTCRLEEVKCEFSDVGCEERFRREDQEEHTRQNYQRHLSLMAASTAEMKHQWKEELYDLTQKLERVPRECELKLQERIENERELAFKVMLLEQTLSDRDKKLRSQEVRLLDQETTVMELKELFKKQQQQLNSTFTKLEEKSQNNEKLMLMLRDKLLTHTFIMKNYSKEKARDKPDDWKSPAMYTHPGGYKFCIGVDANGYGTTRGSAVRVEVRSLRGEHDDQLTWPARVGFTVKLINWSGGKNWKVTELVEWTLSHEYKIERIFTYPESPVNYVFIEHSRLDDYLQDDSLCFKVTCSTVIH